MSAKCHERTFCNAAETGDRADPLLLTGVQSMQGQILSVTVFEAAMGPMIGASIVAMERELDPAARLR
jgi:hypothetical protein